MDRGAQSEIHRNEREKHSGRQEGRVNCKNASTMHTCIYVCIALAFLYTVHIYTVHTIMKSKERKITVITFK